jgi:hypothetical protein
MNTGFQQIDNQLWISKDPTAQLIYTLDWSEWLSPNDEIVEGDVQISARVNDPNPLVKVSSGISNGDKIYVELAAGQVGKSYVVEMAITTSNGLIDRRYFKVKVENRSA